MLFGSCMARPGSSLLQLVLPRSFEPSRGGGGAPVRLPLPGIAFLATLPRGDVERAYCALCSMLSHCAGVSLWRLERFRLRRKHRWDRWNAPRLLGFSRAVPHC